MTRGPNPLTQATAQGLDGPTEIRTGTVTAVTARGITVAVAEGTVPAAHLDSYAPAVGDPVAMAAFRDSWLALGRPVGTGTATDLVTPGSGAGPTVLGGMVLSGTNATMASSTGSFVTVPRYRCTYHHPANHQVMIWGGYTWFGSSVNDVIEVTLTDAVTGVQAMSLTHIQAGTIAVSTFETFGNLLTPTTFGGKKVDLYMQIRRFTGAGTVRVDDIASRRGFLLAMDVADSSVIAVV